MMHFSERKNKNILFLCREYQESLDLKRLHNIFSEKTFVKISYKKCEF